MRMPPVPRVSLLVALLGLLLAGVAGATHSRFEQISEGEINGNGPFGAAFKATSSDGARVSFETSEQLVPGDTDASQDVYERSSGSTKLVSAGQINGNGAFTVLFVGASSDGARVFFATNESLVSTDTDAVQDIYERSNASTKRVSAGQIGGSGALGASFAGASSDGTRVFFVTNEALVSGDTDSSQDVYERSGGSTKRVSGGQINGNGAIDVFFTGASGDGTRVFFRTTESLVSADTDSALDVYERSGGSTKLVSAGQTNGNGPFDASTVRLSADGTRVFFATNESLVATDTDVAQDIYERSKGSTKRVSAGQINGNGAFSAAFAGSSADGTRVFFHTQEQLVSTDTDTIQDVYERSNGSTKRVSAGQINGNGAFVATFSGASADGTRVFFVSSEPLVAADIDTVQDVYERAGGTTSRISRGSGFFSVTYGGNSADGSAVFFLTSEKIFVDDVDAAADIYSAYLAP